ADPARGRVRERAPRGQPRAGVLAVRDRPRTPRRLRQVELRRQARPRARAAGGPKRRLVGLEIDWQGIERLFAKHGLPPSVSPTVDRDPRPVFKDGRQVGRATSTTWSPTLKKMIAFGSLPPSLATLGSRVSVEWTVEGEAGKVGATVVDLPFLDLPRKRA